MRGPIVGGLIFVSLAAAAFACGSSSNNTSSSGADAGYDSGYVYTSPGTSTTYDASTSTTATTTFAGCNVFLSGSAWNTDVSTSAVDATQTTQLTTSFGTGDTIHLNFGKTDDTRGYIINTGTAATTPIGLTINSGATNVAQSDKVACPSGVTGDTCFPIPTTAKISNDNNNTVLFLDTTGTPTGCTAYEVTQASARSGALKPEQDVEFAAKWPLNSNNLKTDQFRSASVSGTSILAGLLKREDITKGTLTHALRVTMPTKYIRNAWVHPATWSNATSTDTTRFALGTRFRLKASVVETSFTGDALIIIRGLKKYGVILTDGVNGNDFSIDGETNDGWTMDDSATGLNDKIADVINITDFEIVNTGAATAATPNND